MCELQRCVTAQLPEVNYCTAGRKTKRTCAQDTLAGGFEGEGFATYVHVVLEVNRYIDDTNP